MFERLSSLKLQDRERLTSKNLIRDTLVRGENKWFEKGREIHRISRVSIALLDCTVTAVLEYGRLVYKNKFSE